MILVMFGPGVVESAVGPGCGLRKLVRLVFPARRTAGKILFDEKPEFGSVVDLLLSLDADVVTRRPTIDGGRWNPDSNLSVCERARERVFITLLERVTEPRL